MLRLELVLESELEPGSVLALGLELVLGPELGPELELGVVPVLGLELESVLVPVLGPELELGLVLVLGLELVLVLDSELAGLRRRRSSCKSLGMELGQRRKLDHL